MGEHAPFTESRIVFVCRDLDGRRQRFTFIGDHVVWTVQGVGSTVLNEFNFRRVLDLAQQERTAGAQVEGHEPGASGVGVVTP